MTILILYITFVAICAVRLMRSRAPILLSGQVLLVFHVCFLTAASAALLVGTSGAQITTWGVLLVLTAAAFLLRRGWLVAAPADFSFLALMKESAARVLLPVETEGATVKLHPTVHAELVRVSPLCMNLAILAFEPAQACGKAMVFQRLLRKRFEGILPKLTIHA